MTAPGIPSLLLPGRVAPRRTKASRCLFHFAAGDGVGPVMAPDGTLAALLARTGQAGTLSRASDAWTLDTAGRIGRAAPHTPRLVGLDLDGDGVRESAGLRLEPATTNQNTSSAAPTWTTSGVTVADGAWPAPNGSTAQTFSETSSGAATRTASLSFATTAATAQAVTLWFRAIGRTWARIRTNDGTTARDSWVNLTTGAAGTTNSGHTLWVDRLADGWVRVRLAVTAAGTNLDVIVGLATQDAETSYTGDGRRALAVWGLQFERDVAWPTSHVRTTGSTATRATETVDFPVGFDVPRDCSLYVALADTGWEREQATLTGIIGVGLAGTSAGIRLTYAAGQLTGTVVVDGGVTVNASMPVAYASDPANPASLLREVVVRVVDLRTGPIAVRIEGPGGASAWSTASSTAPGLPSWGGGGVQLGRVDGITPRQPMTLIAAKVIGASLTLADARMTD